MDKNDIVSKLEQERKDNKNTYANYQIQEIATVTDSFLNEKRKMVLVSDEVGLGKTYVAQGVMRVMKECLNKNDFSVYYFAPNENILSENVEKLLKGIEEKYTSDNRPVLQLINCNEGNNIGLTVYASSPGITFGGKSRFGTVEERKVICAAIQVALKETEYKKVLPIVYSMLYMPRETGDKSKKNGYVLSINGEESTYTWDKEREEFPKWLEGIDDYSCKDWKYKKNEFVEFFKKNVLDSEEKYPMVSAVIKDISKVFDAYCELFNVDEGLSDNEKQKIIIEKTFNCDNISDPTDDTISEVAKKCLEKDDAEDIKYIKEDIMFTYLLGVPFVGSIRVAAEDGAEKYYSFYDVVDDFFQEARNIITSFVFEKIKPDLIILDEFHKYLDEKEKLGIEKILKESKDTKVLLLSATPYSTCLDEIETDPIEKGNGDKNVFSDFASVLAYLEDSNSIGVDENKPDNVKKWNERLIEYYKSVNKLIDMGKGEGKDNWEDAWNAVISEKKQIETDLNGIVVRTERYMAIEQLDSDYLEPILDDGVNEKALRMLGKGYCLRDEQNLQYLLDTPYFLSFAKDYSLKLNDGISGEKLGDLFFDEDEREHSHKKWNALEKNFDFEKMCKLLWLPPANTNIKPEGVFKGSEKLSKLLVFCRYIMSTRAISVLACNKIEKMVSNINKEKYKNVEAAREKLKKEIEKFDLKDLKGELNIQEYDGVNEAFQKYFNNHIDILLCAGVTCIDELYKYCEDGCLVEVIKEYMTLDIEIHTEKKLIEILKCEGMDIRYQSRKQYKEKHKIISRSQDYEKMKCHFAMRLTDDFDDNKETSVYGIKTVKEDFLSPFWPFILSTTSIAQEGIDLHYYCHKIYHWNIPVSPVEFEQREGRINRRKSHLIRKREGLLQENKEYSKIVEKGKGLVPNWYIPKSVLDTSKDAPMATRIISCYPLSKEEKRYEILKDSLHFYRISLGCGIAFDKAKEFHDVCKNNEKDVNEMLLNFSPAFN